jgi:hypothetical protein
MRPATLRFTAPKTQRLGLMAEISARLDFECPGESNTVSIDVTTFEAAVSRLDRFVSDYSANTDAVSLDVTAFEAAVLHLAQFIF